MNDQPQSPPNFHMGVPAELEGGVYSNILSVWHSPYEFTLDFAAMQPAQVTPPSDDDAGGVSVPCTVVARVRIPPTLLFDVLRALNENMTRYEATFGPIKPPGEEQQ